MWAGAQGADRLVLLADDDPAGAPAVMARMATEFAFPVEVRTVAGGSSVPAVPAPLPEVLPADHAPEAVAAMAVEGLEVVAEQGVLRGELLGLEVARVVRWPVEHGGDGELHLEAGVGRFDRDAVAEVHPNEAPEASLARTVSMVRAQRYPGAAGHPMARMARDRWLRVTVCESPSLVGAAELHPVESTVERPSVRDLSPAAAVGTMPDGSPVVVVCTPANFGWVSKLAFQQGTRYVVTLDDQRGGSLLERAAHHSDQHTPMSRRPEDLAAILYTSGTTGRSKGAMLSHANLASNALMLKDYWDWLPGDVLLHTLPIFHVHGLFIAIHAALLNGSTMLWHSKFEPQRVLADMPRATVFMGVPTFYTRLLAQPGLNAQLCSGMRLFISGSAPMLVDTFSQWQVRTGHTVLERYGMSETLMLTSNPYVADERFLSRARNTREAFRDEGPRARPQIHQLRVERAEDLGGSTRLHEVAAVVGSTHPDGPLADAVSLISNLIRPVLFG